MKNTTTYRVFLTSDRCGKYGSPIKGAYPNPKSEGLYTADKWLIDLTAEQFAEFPNVCSPIVVDFTDGHPSIEIYDTYRE